MSGDLGKAGRPSLTIDGGGNLIDGKAMPDSVWAKDRIFLC